MSYKIKRVFSFVLCIVMAVSLLPVLSPKAEAAAYGAEKTITDRSSYASINDIPGVIQKDGIGNDKCTSCAYTALLRRKQYHDGMLKICINFGDIRNSRNNAANIAKGNFGDSFHMEDSFDNSYTLGNNKSPYYAKYTIDSTTKPTTDEGIAKLLDEHPEGVVIYCKYGSGRHHAVLFSDYVYEKADNQYVFYVYDSAKKDKGDKRIPLTESYLYSVENKKLNTLINNITSVWVVKEAKYNSYLGKCDIASFNVGNIKVLTSSAAEMWSMPCNDSISKESYKLELTIPRNKTVEATALVNNTAKPKQYWLRVKYEGKEGYIWSNYVETPNIVVQEYGSCVNLKAKNNNPITFKHPVNHEFWPNDKESHSFIGMLAVAVVQNVFGEYWYKLNTGRYIAASQVDIVKTDWERAKDGFSISRLACPSGALVKGSDIGFSGTANSSTAAISEIRTTLSYGNESKPEAITTGSGQRLDLGVNDKTADYESGPYSYTIKIKLSSYTASNIDNPETYEFEYKSGQFEIADDSFLSSTGAKPVCDIDLQVKFGSLLSIVPITDAKTGKITKKEYGEQQYRALKIVGNGNNLWYQVIYDGGKTGYINSTCYRSHTVNEKPTISANVESVSKGKATVSGNFSTPAWMTVKYVQIDSNKGCHQISSLDGSSYRKTLSETFSAGTHSLTAKVYASFQFAKNGKLEKGSCESKACSFKIEVASEQAPDATSAPTPDATSAPTPIVVSQTALEKEYLDSKCTAYPAYLSLCSNSSTTYIKTLPCSRSTNKNSNDVKRAEKGEPLKAIGLYKNSAGNYWYRVILSDGRAGYIYAGDTVLASNYQYGDALTVSLSSIGTITWGNSTTVNGTVRRSAYLGEMSAVGYLLNPDGSQSSKSGAVVSSKESFTLKGTAIDRNLKFVNLNQGQCTLRVTVTVDSYYSPDGKRLEIKQLSTTKDLKFTVKPLSVSYDANGGSNAPGVQTVKYNKNLKLSSTTPKKVNAEFLGWATSRGSNTVDYKPGTTIKNIKKDIRLYAVWKTIIYYPIDQAHFPDDYFRTYVNRFDKNGDRVLTEDEIIVVKKIACQNMSISSLKGIEYFTALTELLCTDNPLTGLDVSNNTALEYLGCWSNQLTSLDVSGCTALKHIFCQKNKLTNLDISSNTALETLKFWSNQLTSLSVSRCTALTNLDCSNNQLTALDVSRCTALTNLECAENQLTSLDVSRCTALTYLYCGSNHLTVPTVSNRFDLSTLPGFEVSRASNWEGGTLNGSILTFSSDTATYTYDIGNGNFENPTFTLVATTVTETEEELLDASVVTMEELAAGESDAESEGDPIEEIPAEEGTEDLTQEIPTEQTTGNQTEAGNEEESSEDVSAEQPLEGQPEVGQPEEEQTEDVNSEENTANPPEAVPADQEQEEDTETEESPDLETEEEQSTAEAPGEDAAAEPESEPSPPLPEE